MSKIVTGDCLTVLKSLDSESVNCCVTSPPYWGLRDYGHDDQIGLEKTPDEYVSKMVEVFREVRRVLRNDGTLWLNLGDSYSGPMGNNRGDGAGGGQERGEKLFGSINRSKDRSTDRWGGGKNKVIGLEPKNLVGIPWRVAFALQADGWYLRQDIIWHKPNPMPESVTDRCTKAHEYIFLLAKSAQYYFDEEAIRERSVYDDPRMVDGFVPKSVNGKHTIDKQNAANRKKFKPTEAGGGTSMVDHNGYFKGDGEPIGNPGFRNKRSVWSVTTSPFKGAHFATFPEELITPCILAGCPKDGVVLDPFFGAGTTGVVSKTYGREYIGIELNPEYVKIAERRLLNVQEPFL